jgi:hypothetical protein
MGSMKKVAGNFWGILSAAIVVLSLSSMQAQEPWKTITIDEYEKKCLQVEEFYKKHTKYSVNVLHSSYQGHASNAKLYERSEGYFRRDADQFHSYLLGIHTIQNETVRIIVDSVQKTIHVSNVEKLSTEQAMPVSWMFSKKSIEKCYEIPFGKSRVYKLSFPKGGSYTSFEIKISEKMNIEEIVFYYSSSYPSDPGNPKSPKVSPKLVISFSGFSQTTPITKNDFSTQRYITIDKNNKILPTSAYQSYRLMDARIKK